MADFLLSLRELNIWSMILRIFLAVIMGGLIGLEREIKGRPAGFRTYMLVSLGAALTVMLGQYLSVMLNTLWADTAAELGAKVDVTRIAAQVINGVGFLGAGTIIVTGHQQVKGITTAAGLWASACMGISIGAGFYECTIVGFVLILFSIKLLPAIESAVLSRARNLNIYVEMDSIENLGCIVNRIKSEGLQLYDVEIDKEEHGHIKQVNAFFSLRMPCKKQHTEILAMLSTLNGVISIEEV